MQPDTSVQTAPREGRARFDIRALGPLLGLIALFVAGALLNDAFLSQTNLFNVLTRSAFIGIIAVGATFVIISGGLDLSVGSMAAFIAGVMIIVMNQAVGTFGAGVVTVLIGIVASLVLGVIAGLINGLIITRGKIAAFIVTLGTLGIYRSLVTYLANGGTLSLDFNVRTVYGPVYSGSFLGVLRGGRYRR
jgi:ribose transport system permease protein